MDPSGFTSTLQQCHWSPACTSEVRSQPVLTSTARDLVAPTCGSCSEGLLVTAATRDAEIVLKEGEKRGLKCPGNALHYQHCSMLLTSPPTSCGMIFMGLQLQGAETLEQLCLVLALGSVCGSWLTCTLTHSQWEPSAPQNPTFKLYTSLDSFSVLKKL